MNVHYAFFLVSKAARSALFLGLVLLTALGARAQLPGWASVVPSSPAQLGGVSVVQDAATDGAGNILVTGYFTGVVSFGSFRLVSAGSRDLFVAKYVPATSTWAWVLRGGGTGNDQGNGLAVSGSSIYVAGFADNNSRNESGVSFGPGNVQPGIAQAPKGPPIEGSYDLLLLKYTDAGTSASLNWSLVAGGGGNDQANDVAVSGSSIYLVGTQFNNQSNFYGSSFGNSGVTPGPAQQAGAHTSASDDLVLAKYTDNGASATFNWSQVGGGNGADQGNAIAVSGKSVYVAGAIVNNTANLQYVLFGGSGLTAGTAKQYGASTSSSQDMVLAKYTDNGSSATLGWTHVAGGSAADYASKLVASGSSVYVAGSFTNSLSNANSVVFGGNGMAIGGPAQYGASTNSTLDLMLAKYTDNGASATFNWSQVAGGKDTDRALGLAQSGNALYVTGSLLNNQNNANAVTFGGGGTVPGTAAQPGLAVGTASTTTLVVARYTDNGASAAFNWSQVAGGNGSAVGQALTLVGTTALYVGGYVYNGRTTDFGTATNSPLVGNYQERAVLARLGVSPTAGTWQAVAAGATGGPYVVRAAATDAAGNIFVTGSFSGQLAFGSTLLSGANEDDLFVAKYVPGSGTWAWAQSAGGSGNDVGNGIAVSGNSVYVTGSIQNTAADDLGVRFGGTSPLTHTATQAGISPNRAGNTQDIVLAKYTDNGTSATFNWSQVGGGTDADYGYGIATGPAGSVYVVGSFTNDSGNSKGGVLGGSGSSAGTVPVYGATAATSADILLVKYRDQGASASVAWSQVAGGSTYDQGSAVAVSGSSVYLTGYISNTLTNTQQVVFGGGGTTVGAVPQYGTSTTANSDLLLAKYTDNGASATLGWTQVAGGERNDRGNAVAVSGNQVFVTGALSAGLPGAPVPGNAPALFGGSGTTPGTLAQYGATTAYYNTDIVTAKYLDNGPTASVAWVQVGGGTEADQGQALAVQGNTVWVAGSLSNDAANSAAAVFGATGATAGTAPQPGVGGYVNTDVLVARYTDLGTTATLAGTRVAGSQGRDLATGLVLAGSQPYVVGQAYLPATFGNLTLDGPNATITGFLAGLDATMLAVRASAPASGLTLYPNPAAGGAATLTGATPGAAVQVLDVLGRALATTVADVRGTARLAGLAPGLYLVRAGSATVRLVVQ